MAAPVSCQGWAPRARLEQEPQAYLAAYSPGDPGGLCADQRHLWWLGAKPLHKQGDVCEHLSKHLLSPRCV